MASRRIAPWYENARWIWIDGFDDTRPEGQICLFKRQFHLDSVRNETCILRVSADTRYKLYVNGVRVSIGPCKSYPGRWHYETVDIRPHLKVGANLICAEVLRFSTQHAGSMSLMRSALPGLIVWCEVQGQRLHTDDQWLAIQDHSIEMASRMDWNFALGPPFLVLNEHTDGRKRQQGWLTSGESSSTAQSWQKAKVVTMRSMMMPVVEPRKLVERPIPPMDEREGRFDNVIRCSEPSMMSAWTNLIHHDSVVEVQPHETTWVELECKDYRTAYIHFKCSASSGSRITILCSEGYETPMPREGPGATRTKGDRSDHRNGKLYGITNSYTTHDGDNSYEPFWFSAFRYVRLQIEAKAGPVSLSSFAFRTSYYPLEIQTRLESTQPQMNNLFTTSINTLRNCMHETYEDCPFYEQNQFLMDSRLQMLFTYQLSRDDRLACKTMHEFHASRREDGLLQAQFPSPGRTVNIPMFSLFFIPMVHDHMLYFRDQGLVRQYLCTIDGILDHFGRLVHTTTEGLVGHFEDPDDWAFVDWVAEWAVGPPLHGLATPPTYYRNDRPATIFSLLYAWALQLAADLAQVAQRHDTATEYRKRATDILAAVNKHCFDNATRFYTDAPDHQSFSQHCQVFAILTGAVAGDVAVDLLSRTMEAVAAGKMPKCSYAMSFYVFRAAQMAGLYERLWPQLIEPWNRMLENNLVTFAESESMARSDCHGWSAVPIYEIVAEVCGVKPTMDAALEVRPKMSLLAEGFKAQIVTTEGLLTISTEAGQALVQSDFDGEVILGNSGRAVQLKRNTEVRI